MTGLRRLPAVFLAAGPGVELIVAARTVVIWGPSAATLWGAPSSMATPAYATLLTWLPEACWGLGALIIAALLVWAILLNGGATWRSAALRLSICSVMAAANAALAAGFALQGPWSTAVRAYSLDAVLCVLAGVWAGMHMLRLAHDQR